MGVYSLPFPNLYVGEDGESNKPYFGEYPKDFLILIIDECHRGGANDE